MHSQFLESRCLMSASVAPDLTVVIITSSTGTFVGGNSGTISVSVGNAGAQLAVGTEIVSVFVSPDASLADATLITAVQETGKEPGGAAQTYNIPFLFPGIAMNAGRFIATVASASQVVDSDLTNDVAVGSLPVTIIPPDADLAAQNVSLLGVPTTGIVAGQKMRTLVTVKNTGNVPVSGPVSINLLVADDTAGTNSIALIAAPAVRNINLPPGSAVTFPITGTIPNVEGSKYVLATVDSSAATLETDLTNNITSAAAPIQISSAQVTLREQILANPPPSVVSGSPGSLMLRVFNDGNVSFRGPLPVSLYASLDNNLDTSDERMILSNRSASILPGKFQDIAVGFTYPTDLPDNNYYLLSQIGATSTAFRGVFSSGPIPVAASDISATTTVVNISLPFVTLTPVFGTLPGTAFTANEPLTLPLNLINSGNVLASGQYSIEILASPSTDPNDPAALSLTSSVKRHLALKANSTMTMSFRVTVPNTLVAGVNYYFAARVVADAIPAITTARPTAFSTPFILTT